MSTTTNHPSDDHLEDLVNQLADILVLEPSLMAHVGEAIRRAAPRIAAAQRAKAA